MKKLIGTLALCLFLASCVEEIVMSPEEKRAVNVECVLENSETQTLHLNYTAYISENSYTPVEKADVKVVEYIKGNVSYLKKNEYEFSKVKDGEWSANFIPIPAAKYELEILIPGEDSITATTYYVEDTTMFRWFDYLDRLFPNDNPGTRALQPLETLTGYSTVLNTPEYSFNDVRKGEFPLFRFCSEHTFPLWIYGMDYDPAKDEYCQAELITIPYPDSLRILSAVDPYYDWIDRFNVVDVKREDVAEFRYPDDAGIEFPHVLEYGYPQYLHGEYNATTTDMHYRYLRLQCSFNQPRVDKILEKVESEEFYLDDYFPCEFCGHIYVAASFRQYRYGIPHPKAYLVFQVANEDYDRYLKTLVSWSQKKEYGGNTSLTDIWEYQTPLYSNINNGLGIFGTKYVKRVPYMDYKSITYKGTTYYKKYTLE